MRVRKREKGGAFKPAVDGVVRRQEIEADVLEIWIVASRLLGRLTESSPPPIRRKAQPHGRTVRAARATGTQSALIP